MNQFKISIVLLFLLSSCGRFSNEEKKEEQTNRIVSAAKQYTEIIYALGIGDKLVAVDISSTYPPEVKELPTIGYHMHLSFEGIIVEIILQTSLINNISLSIFFSYSIN